MSNQIGYFAVIMPKRKEYKEIVLVDDLQHETEVFLKRLRYDPATAEVINQSEEIRWLVGVRPVDQNILGGLCAALARRAEAGDMRPLSMIAYAISTIIGTTYFYVVAFNEPGGTRTMIDRIPAASIEAAKAYIDNLPEVSVIKIVRELDELLRRK